MFFALLEYFVVLFGIRYDKYWRHKKQDLERINATTWERPNENTQPALAAVAAAAAASASSNNTNATNHHRPTQLPPLLHHRATNNRVDNLKLFGGSSKIMPQEEMQDHDTKDMASPQSTIIRVSSGDNGIIPNLHVAQTSSIFLLNIYAQKVINHTLLPILCLVRHTEKLCLSSNISCF